MQQEQQEHPVRQDQLEAPAVPDLPSIQGQREQLVKRVRLEQVVRLEHLVHRVLQAPRA